MRDREFADSLLEEAVTSEPVSEAKFPVRWENTRNFHRQALRSRKTVENREAATATYEEIPYAPEQGIFGLEQGIGLRDQGIFYGDEGIRNLDGH